MITIIGGELLSALNSEHKCDLRNGRPNIGKVDVSIGKDKISYPYYLIDNKPRVASYELVDSYLDLVFASLLRKLALRVDDLTRIGLFLGSSSIDFSQVGAIEQVVENDSVAGLRSERVGGGNYINRLMQRFGLDGPALTYNTACTSSANALMDAASMLEGGIIDHALVFGLEVSSPTTLLGFVAMQLLTQAEIRPFDVNRSGMVLGEAVSAVLLSRDDIRPAPWHYLGGRSNCEIHTITGANPNGEGIAQVIQGALDDTATRQADLTAIKAHGTSSELMDLAELRAMAQAFDDIPPYFSLKPYIGHTLGGCGVAELVLMMTCIDAGFIPATINFTKLDEEFSTPPISSSRSVGLGRFMLNYFGFGGNNTSFIIEKL